MAPRGCFRGSAPSEAADRSDNKRFWLIDGAASMTGALLLLDSGGHLGHALCWGGTAR